MRDDLIKTYSNTKKSLKEAKRVKNTISVSFNDSPKVSINGPVDHSYTVKFINNETGYTTYTCEIKNNMWCKSTISYYIEWRIIVESGGQIVFDEILDLKDKRVLVVIDSQSLGDILAYVGQIDRFQIKHNCKMDVLTFNKELCQIFDSSYENMNFILDAKKEDYYAVYNIGYPLDNWRNRNPIDPRTIPLQQVASSVLGLFFKEERPILTFSNSKNTNKKYVTIGTQSTAQCKYWNNEKGWEEVIKYLNSKGYEVWCIDRFPSFGNPSGKINYIPKGAIDKTGDLPLEIRMSQIYNSEFFIGLGSGLSWLAWALNKPTVLISGFSKAFAEFETPYRVINESVCNGCWNDTDLKFDKSNWMWCPRNKNFECSKQISAKMVIDKIDFIINPNKERDDVASIILCHPDSPKKIELVKKCIEHSSGAKIVSSNYQLDDEIQKISDYCLVSNKNEILKQEDFSKFGVDYLTVRYTPIGNFSKRFEFEHGYAVYCLIRDGLRLAKSLGYKKAHVINYDYLISKETFKNHLLALENNDCVFYDYQKEYYNENSFNTGFFSGETDILLKFFEYYKTKGEYYRDPTPPVNILEIKICKFFEKRNIKIFKIPNSKIIQNGNKINIVEVFWKDERINIPP